MKNNNFILLLVGILAVVSLGFILNNDQLIWSHYYNKLTAYQPLAESTRQVEEVKSEVIVVEPQPGEVVTSPLQVIGQASGDWFFEGSFPVKLVAVHGKVLATGAAEGQGEWMTDELVDFIVTLTWDSSEVDQGELILEKDNPSGLPENAGQWRVPVKFALP